MRVSWAEILEGLAFAGAIAGLIWNALEARRATRLQMFTEYTRRYQEIMLMIPLSAFGEEYDFAALEERERAETLAAMRAFFDMCSEELFLNKKGKLEPAVWRYWRNGMTDLLRHPAFKVAWELIRQGKYYHRDFEAFIEEIKAG